MLDVAVLDDEIARRLSAHRPARPELGGVLGRYRRLVGSAAHGALLD